jgi:PAS domain S-box-containing protein
MKNIKLLIVDDDEDDYFLVADHLNEIEEYQLKITWVATYEDGLNQMKEGDFDISLFDFLLGQKTGLNLLRQVRDLGIDTPIILLTGRGNKEVDREATLLGATDYLIKSDLDADTLERSIRYALTHAQALKAVKANERLYRNIFNRSRDMIYLANTNNGVFIDVNERGTDIFGYSHDEFMSMKTIDLLYDKQESKSLSKILFETGELRDCETTFVNKWGQKMICIINGIIYTEGGTVYHHGSVQDVTAIRLLERNRLNLEKIAATGRFTRALAHEIRNPLTNIDLSVEQLGLENKDDELTYYFDIIKRNSHRIGNLITELLQTSNPAHIELKKQPVNDLVEKAVDTAHDRILLKNIKTLKHYTPENPLINADASKLQMALTNLIINAVEAMTENNGVLTIETESLTDSCRIIIEDNGCGMTAEQQNRLFEPYFTAKSKGLGLGMTTIMNIVQAHGGQLLFTSELHKGTRFFLSFPIQ